MSEGIFTYFVAAGLIVSANIIVFILTVLFHSEPNYMASLILTAENLAKGNLGCLLTAGFVHGNFMHLCLNVLGICIFAPIVERKFGSLKTLFIYFGAMGCSMTAAIFIYTFLLGRDVHLLGASGGLMGLIACAMLVDPFAVTYETLFPIPVMVKGWMFIYIDVLGFLGGEGDGISHLTHLLGFLSIGVLVYFLNSKDRKLMQEGLWANTFFVILFIVLSFWVSLNA